MDHKDKSSYLVPFEVFKKYEQDAKLNTLFHYASASYYSGKEVEQRVQKLERKKWFDKGLSVSSGGVGGFVALVVKWMFEKLS